MEPKNNIQLTLTDAEVGQLLDGLSVREDAWRQTAMLMRGEMPDDPSVCEDCNGVEEAEAIYGDYSELTAKIQRQYWSQVPAE
jgi:hypothetical protein